MYKLDRIMEPVGNIAFTHSMYEVDRYWNDPLLQSENHPDEETLSFLNRLDTLEVSVDHLLKLLQSGSKLTSTKRPISETGKAKVAQSVNSKPRPLVTPQQNAVPSVSLAVQANPSRPPLSLLLFCRAMLESDANFTVLSHVHSSVDKLPKQLVDFMKPFASATKENNGFTLRIVWTTSCPDCMMFVDINSTNLYGEVMLMHKLLTLIPQSDVAEQYELLTQIDSLQFNGEPTRILDLIAHNSHFKGANRKPPSITDCFLYVTVHRQNLANCLPDKLSGWNKLWSKNSAFSHIKSM